MTSRKATSLGWQPIRTSDFRGRISFWLLPLPTDTSHLLSRSPALISLVEAKAAPRPGCQLVRCETTHGADPHPRWADRPLTARNAFDVLGSVDSQGDMSDARYSQSVDQLGTMGDLSAVPSSISEGGGQGVGVAGGLRSNWLGGSWNKLRWQKCELHGGGNRWARCQRLLSLARSSAGWFSVSHTHTLATH